MRPRVFFDFAIGTEPAGRVVFELYNDTAPKTAENFRALCTGEKGLSAVSERPLYYKNSIIHRSIRDFMVQGGDFTKRNGAGGESIYGSAFPDEDLTRPLESEGLLCMANKGPNTNGSQFFITLRDCPHLNGKHVVFGRVMRGYDEVVKKLAVVPVDEKDRPQHPIVIVNCGELELKRKAEASQELNTEIPSRRHRSSRSRSRSSDHDRSTQKRKKSKRRKHENKRDTNTDDEVRKNEDEKVPKQETEEEYDARLEREEQERLDEAKQRELERIKRKYESTPPATEGGVRFKGRGRMKFIDPELHHRR
ncbi:cyclophilin-like domain-containing protein [Suillus clintonianus]|uniref:cyclophilin-like domain-containing protein n=1 Tax=Suillus clintonianus TaxID=1904413 RepID=UPI001B85F86C|nr:cyclophilin-like domain-containing protein [Suillus clintonianus]KAG2145223.1 cyclophilin-like domain-containing protein [Suillus clintonianus]